MNCKIDCPAHTAPDNTSSRADLVMETSKSHLARSRAENSRLSTMANGAVPFVILRMTEQSQQRSSAGPLCRFLKLHSEPISITTVIRQAPPRVSSGGVSPLFRCFNPLLAVQSGNI